MVLLIAHEIHSGVLVSMHHGPTLLASSAATEQRPGELQHGRLHRDWRQPGSWCSSSSSKLISVIMASGDPFDDFALLRLQLAELSAY